jgi:hypothetical protein
VYGTDYGNSQEHYQLLIPEVPNKIYYIYKRTYREKPTLTRMENIYVTAGEIWYLRLILLKRPIISYEDAYTGPAPDYFRYYSFQEAAIKHGLVKDRHEAETCFEEALPHSTPVQLRGLFANMMINGFPVKCIYDRDDMFTAMISDYVGTTPQKRNKFLQNLQQRLQNEGKSLEDYGFPVPALDDTELNRERLKYDMGEQLELYNR